MCVCVCREEITEANDPFSPHGSLCVCVCWFDMKEWKEEKEVGGREGGREDRDERWKG